MSTGKFVKYTGLFFALCVIFMVHSVSSYAVNNYHEGPYINTNGDSLLLARDPQFKERTTGYSKGETVYVRAITSRLRQDVLTARISFFDFQGNEIQKSDLQQKTMTEPYVFEGNIVVPQDVSSYAQLDLRIEWGRAGRVRGVFVTTQALEIGGVDGTIRFYRDEYNTESYAFVENDRLYIKAWGRDEHALFGIFILRSFDGEVEHYPLLPSMLSKEGQWHKAWVNVNNLKMKADNWYQGTLFLPQNNGAILRSSKLFLIDTSSPVARITSPQSGEASNVLVGIVGEASDATLKRYEIYVRETSSTTGNWETLNVNGTISVYNNVLYPWNAEKYLGKEVDIRLLVEDAVGNKSEDMVKKIKIDGSLSFNVPTNVALNEITASTIDTDAMGSIGDGAESDFNVVDGRVSKPGWSATVSFSDFINEDERIPVSALRITPQKVRIISGSDNGIVIGSEHQFIDERDQALLMSAPPGSGFGNFFQQILLKLRVTAGSAAGTYTSIATFTVQ